MSLIMETWTKSNTSNRNSMDNQPEPTSKHSSTPNRLIRKWNYRAQPSSHGKSNPLWLVTIGTNLFNPPPVPTKTTYPPPHPSPETPSPLTLSPKPTTVVGWKRRVMLKLKHKQNGYPKQMASNWKNINQHFGTRGIAVLGVGVGQSRASASSKRIGSVKLKLQLQPTVITLSYKKSMSSISSPKNWRRWKRKTKSAMITKLKSKSSEIK
jgi:hypothetical protein